jgi:hypothetical protein
MSGAELLWRYSAHDDEDDEDDKDSWMVYGGACDLGRRQYRILFGSEVVETEFSVDLDDVEDDWKIHGLVFAQKANALIAVATRKSCDAFVNAVHELLHTDPWLSSLPTIEDVD